MRGKHQVVLLALFACSLLMVPIAAHATNCLTDTCLELTISDGTHTYDSGLVGSPVLVSGLSLGNFMITIQGSGVGTVNFPTLLDLFNLDIANHGTSGNLTVTLTEVNIGGIGPGTNAYSSDVGGSQSSGSSLHYQGCFDAGNHAGKFGGGCGAGTTTIQDKTFTSTSYSNTSIGNATNTGLFSLTDIATMFISTGGTTSFDGAFSIPEPATLSVLGAGLLAFGTGLRRKLRRG